MRAHRRVLPTVLLTGAVCVLPGPVAVEAANPGCRGEPATIVGTRGDDRLTGTRRADVIVGRGGDDRVDGRGGRDLVCGGRGADRIDGGPRDDRLYGGPDRLTDGPAGRYRVGDVLTGGPGDDTLAGGVDGRAADQVRRPDTYSWADAPRRVTVDLSGRSAESGTAAGRGSDTVVISRSQRIVGSPYADRITGSSRQDRVDGGAGDDDIRSGRGDDTVYPDGPGPGQGGSDVVRAGRGRDLVSSLTGRDRLSGGGGDDWVEAFSDRPSRVATGGGDDYLGQQVTPGSGARADGGAGRDVVAFYGSLLRGQQPPARFVVDYRDGTTRATGTVDATGRIGDFEAHRLIGPLRWGYFGSARADRVWAIGGGPLRARAYGGDDQVTGSDRDDLIAGGAGTDTGWGRGGKDDCRNIERGDC